MSIVIYKVKSTRTGLFSTGGGAPRFSKSGKIWKRKGDLTCHLNQLSSLGARVYQDHEVEILEYEVKEELANVHTYAEWMQSVEERKQKREDDAKARTAQWKKDRDLQELERLRKLYPNG